MHVQIEGLWPSGMERDDEAGLFAGLAERGAGEIALVALLVVPAGLDPAVQLAMNHKADTEARRIDHHRAPGEVSDEKPAGEVRQV